MKPWTPQSCMAMSDQDDDEEQDLAPDYRGIKRDHQY
jgi:hypothetical protein